MAIKETIYLHRKHRVCIGNSGAQKMWNRYSFWTHASDVEFDDGSTLDSKISNIKGITKNIDAGAGYAADVSLVKSIRDNLKSLIDNLSNVVNNINNRLGGLRFYEDSNGKWVVGADSVPKKLGSGLEDVKITDSGNFNGNTVTYTSTVDGAYILLSGETSAGSNGNHSENNDGYYWTGCWTDITTTGKIITELGTHVGVHNDDKKVYHPDRVSWVILAQCDKGQSVSTSNVTWGNQSANNGHSQGIYLIMNP